MELPPFNRSHTTIPASFASEQAQHLANISHSGTNNQVAGVNEGDIVQADGTYLFDLSNNQLVIGRIELALKPAVNLQAGR